MTTELDPTLRGIVLLFKYNLSVNGVSLLDEAAMHDRARCSRSRKRFGDQPHALLRRFVRGLALAT